MNIYKSDIAVSREKKEDGDGDEDDDEDDDQKVTLDELLDNLVLDSKPNAGDDAAMQLGSGDAADFTNT